jgi:hypothetical protein
MGKLLFLNLNVIPSLNVLAATYFDMDGESDHIPRKEWVLLSVFYKKG